MSLSLSLSVCVEGKAFLIQVTAERRPSLAFLPIHQRLEQISSRSVHHSSEVVAKGYRLLDEEQWSNAIMVAPWLALLLVGNIKASKVWPSCYYFTILLLLLLFYFILSLSLSLSFFFSFFLFPMMELLYKQTMERTDNLRAGYRARVTKGHVLDDGTGNCQPIRCRSSSTVQFSR